MSCYFIEQYLTRHGFFENKDFLAHKKVLPLDFCGYKHVMAFLRL